MIIIFMIMIIIMIFFIIIIVIITQPLAGNATLAVARRDLLWAL